MSQQQAAPQTQAQIEADKKPPALVEHFVESSGLSPGQFMDMLERSSNQCRGAERRDYYKLLEVAKKYDLDPLVKQLYLIETKQGAQVVIAIDGWLHIMHRHPDYLAHEIIENKAKPGDVLHPELLSVGCDVVSVTLRLWTGKRKALGLGPYEWTEYMRECYVPTQKRGGYSGPWQTHPSRMLRHKAGAQGIRYELGVYVPTEDEFARAGLLLDDVLERTERGEAATDTRKPATPVVPIAGLRPPGKPEFAPAPSLEDEPQGSREPATSATVAASEAAVGTAPVPGPADLPDPDSPEGRALAAELDREAAEAEKPKTGLFES